ncbi:acyltransferase family protein [Pedobacter sp. UC225_65]|uniref:acyltransferase family protein n=1 Tax=Pedobacter sp. UC225_65 TaxID=3350173 RepID=UPI00366CE7BA
MAANYRRYDIDWLRVIAIGLLLVYHLSIGFQPWGIMIGFIVNDKTWESLWLPMTMLNIWRIPLLFFVSGMGVYFAIQNRNWKQLLLERGKRILIPFVFGFFCIVPLHIYLWQYANQWELSYNPNPGHLWFLGNIFSYVVILLPIFMFLKKKENGQMGMWIKKWFATPLSLLVVIAAFVAEAVWVNPMPYELYAMTWHGFFLGILAFFFGFCFMLAGNDFWNMLLKWKWLFLLVAIALYAWRIMQPQLRVPIYQLPIESIFWLLSVFAFGFRHLNHPSTVLRYLSQAAYPIYILHMLFLFLGSVLIFPLAIDVRLKFVMVLLFTSVGCLALYEFVIRRIGFLRLLFGLKNLG